MTKLFKAIGLMSGTSLDGIDLALIESDGKEIINRKYFDYLPYNKEIKNKLINIIQDKSSLEEIKLAENELSELHGNFVKDFISKNRLNSQEIDLIAFHGHTIAHNPDQGITWQIANKDIVEKITGIKTITNFRQKDVAHGGQGAPLVPIYHLYLFAKQEKPVAALNIGGISNISYFQDLNEDEMIAFDICFGNAPLDDLTKEKLQKDYDKNGEIAKSGKTDLIFADRILQNEIFNKKPPKSFDRDDFKGLLAPIKNLKIEDALATLTYMHAKAIETNLKFLPKPPKTLFLCGGGRKNNAIFDELKKWLTDIEVKKVEEINLNGDAIEAEAFAFLGIRKKLNLPISFKNTTGSSLKTRN